jgi:integrase
MARRRRGQFPEARQENGQWKIRYWKDEVEENGVRRRVRKTKCLGSTDRLTFRQAQKEAVRFLLPVNDVEERVEYSGKTMHDLIGRWRESVKPALKLSTQASYQWAFERILPAFGRTPLQLIGKADVQSFVMAASLGGLKGHLSKPLSGESIRDLRARLRGLLSSAEDWGWIPRGTNPAAGRLKLPSRDPVREKKILRPAELWQLAGALRQPYGTIVVLAALTGLRKGELEALRWNDNLEPGGLRVDEAVHRGKLGSPKTKRSNRVVSIGPLAQKAIDNWRAVAPFRAADDFMFGVRTNTPIDLHNVLARHVKPTAKKLKLPAVSWHDLRRTYATWGSFAGVNPETMRDQLGHSSVLMTLDVYSRAGVLKDRSGEVARVERYVWAEAQKVPTAAVQ